MTHTLTKLTLVTPRLVFFRGLYRKSKCQSICPLRLNLEGWIARTFLRLYQVTPRPPGMEDAELIIDSVHSLMGKIPFYELELPYFYVKCVGYMPIFYND